MWSQNCLCNANPDINRIICLRLHSLIAIPLDNINAVLSWLLRCIHMHCVLHEITFLWTPLRLTWMEQNECQRQQLQIMSAKCQALSDIVRISHLHTWNTHLGASTRSGCCSMAFNVHYSIYVCICVSSHKSDVRLCIVNYYDYDHANAFSMFRETLKMTDCFGNVFNQ